MARRDIRGVVDFDHLERYAGGDEAVVEEVLALFREQSQIWMRLLDPAAAGPSWRDGAHAMKGAALGVGAFQLAAVCGEAEFGDAPLREALLGRIRTALDAALHDIAAYTHERALQSLKTPRG